MAETGGGGWLNTSATTTTISPSLLPLHHRHRINSSPATTSSTSPPSNGAQSQMQQQQQQIIIEEMNNNNNNSNAAAEDLVVMIKGETEEVQRRGISKRLHPTTINNGNSVVHVVGANSLVRMNNNGVQQLQPQQQQNSRCFGDNEEVFEIDDDEDEEHGNSIPSGGAALSKIGLFSPVLMLTKAIIGTAILVFPRCFLRAGIFPAMGALVLAAFVANFVADIVMRVKEFLNVSTYRACAEMCFGVMGGIVLDMAIFIQSFGTLTGYTMVVGDVLPPVLFALSGISPPQDTPAPAATIGDLFNFGYLSSEFLHGNFHQEPGNINITDAGVLGSAFTMLGNLSLRTFSMAIVSSFILFPLCLLRSLDSLRALTASSFVGYIIILLIILREAFRRVIVADIGFFVIQLFGESDLTRYLFGHLLSNLPPTPTPLTTHLHWTGVSAAAFLNVLPIITLSFSCVPFMFEVYKTLLFSSPPLTVIGVVANGSSNLKDSFNLGKKAKRNAAMSLEHRASKTWRRISCTAFTVAAILYITFGFVGVLAFRGNTQVNILSNLEQAVGGFVANCASILFAVSLIASYPIIMTVVRQPVRRVLHALCLDELASLICFRNMGTSSPEKISSPNPSKLVFVSEALFVLSFSLCVAIYVPGIDFFLALIGGTASVFVSYLFPVLMFYKSRPPVHFQRAKYRAIVVAMLGLLVVSVTFRGLLFSNSSRH